VGYSRLLLKTDMHLLTAEIGYDYTFQDNVTGPNLSIHSARVFSGYTLTLSKDVGLAFGLEVLCNLNELPGFQPMQTVGAFHDTRVNGNAALTARLWKNIAFQVSFIAKYTTDPAPLPAIAGASAFDTSVSVPLAQPLDTVTSLSLVVTLL
jgi:putative salt-induced outer membrane protein YdiY